MNKTFGELAVGDRFVVSGTEYVKTSEVRVSCCRSVNCQSISNPEQKNFISTDTVVTVNG